MSVLRILLFELVSAIAAVLCLIVGVSSQSPSSNVYVVKLSCPYASFWSSICKYVNLSNDFENLVWMILCMAPPFLYSNVWLFSLKDARNRRVLSIFLLHSCFCILSLWRD